MRSIPLLTKPLMFPPAPDMPPLVYREALAMIVRHTPQGVRVGEMAAACAVLAALDRAGKSGAASVLLEEEAYRYLLARVEEFPFSLADPAIEEMVRVLRDAPPTDANPISIAG